MSEKVERQFGLMQDATMIGGSNGNNGNNGNNGRLVANRIFVGNIPASLAERDLITLFHRFGKIRDVKIIPENSRNKSYGFVTFFSEADARRAIQASVQHDSITWGDRKLNVAPAVKRNNIHVSSSQNGFYSMPRIATNSFYGTPVQMPIFSGSGENHTSPVESVPIDANNGHYQTIICRMPHQYAMSPYQFQSPPTGHYYVSPAPNYQPYIQPVGVQNSATHYNSTSNYCGQDNFRTGVSNLNTCSNHPVVPLTPNSSSDNTDGQLEDGSDNSQAGEKTIDSHTVGDGSEVIQHESTAVGVGEAYSMQPVLCCPHHSCMLSPVSPVTRPCQMLHPANCFAAAAPPMMYSSPIMYGNSGRRPPTRLQRWNSLDANLQGAQVPWNSESWPSRPSLDDSYGSETALFPPHRMERPMRPAYSCQSHPHGMYSPFCRSFEYNLWGQAQNNNVDPLLDASAAPPTSSSHTNLALGNINLNENPPPPPPPPSSDQLQPQSNK